MYHALELTTVQAKHQVQRSFVSMSIIIILLSKINVQFVSFGVMAVIYMKYKSLAWNFKAVIIRIRSYRFIISKDLIIIIVTIIMWNLLASGNAAVNLNYLTEHSLLNLPLILVTICSNPKHNTGVYCGHHIHPTLLLRCLQLSAEPQSCISFSPQYISSGMPGSVSHFCCQSFGKV